LLTRLEGEKCMIMSHSELERVIEVDCYQAHQMRAS
jgi:hypothetical protein